MCVQKRTDPPRRLASGSLLREYVDSIIMVLLLRTKMQDVQQDQQRTIILLIPLCMLCAIWADRRVLFLLPRRLSGNAAGFSSLTQVCCLSQEQHACNLT
jgi:hypothetical protein